MQILGFIGVLSMLSSLTVILTEYLSKFTKVSGGWARAQSWVVAIIIGFIANALGFGFGNLSLFASILCGIMVGIFANGVFSLELVKAFLTKFKVGYVA